MATVDSSRKQSSLPRRQRAVQSALNGIQRLRRAQRGLFEEENFGGERPIAREMVLLRKEKMARVLTLFRTVLQKLEDTSSVDRFAEEERPVGLSPSGEEERERGRAATEAWPNEGERREAANKPLCTTEKDESEQERVREAASLSERATRESREAESAQSRERASEAEEDNRENIELERKERQRDIEKGKEEVETQTENEKQFEREKERESIGEEETKSFETTARFSSLSRYPMTRLEKFEMARLQLKVAQQYAQALSEEEEKMRENQTKRERQSESFSLPLSEKGTKAEESRITKDDEKPFDTAFTVSVKTAAKPNVRPSGRVGSKVRRPAGKRDKEQQNWKVKQRMETMIGDQSRNSQTVRERLSVSQRISGDEVREEVEREEGRRREESGELFHLGAAVFSRENGEKRRPSLGAPPPSPGLSPIAKASESSGLLRFSELNGGTSAQSDRRRTEDGEPRESIKSTEEELKELDEFLLTFQSDKPSSRR